MNQKIIIADINGNDGRKLNEIFTKWGESLVNFHHRIFFSHGNGVELYDASHYYRKFGVNGANYYHFLSLLICYGILLESFWINSLTYERNFVATVVKPAFDDVTKKFGLRPLIVRLLDEKEDGNPYWECYPEHILKEIDEL